MFVRKDVINQFKQGKFLFSHDSKKLFVQRLV